MKPALTEFTPAELSEALDIKPYQGKQLFRWIHGKRVFDPGQMTDLSKDLRARIERDFRITQLTPLHIVRSATSKGTKKAVFQLHDGETVESVLIRDGNRNTICLSSQVGCAVKCSFCATGLSGYRRNLSPGEIVEQALHILADEDLGDRTPNIVYMGMGEPFRNYDSVVQSVRMLMQKDGLGIGARKITVSTVGEVKGIERFASEGWQVRLSVSLHAANDALRSELVPLNRKYPLKTLVDSIQKYTEDTGRQITFEYTLIKGVNDSDTNADELIEIAKNTKSMVNLIPYNAVAGLRYAPPPIKHCQKFRDKLTEAGIRATLRHERGQDIDAACGQLRRHLEEDPPHG